jgi:cytochrome P450
VSNEPVIDPSLLVGSAMHPAPLIAKLREHDPVAWVSGFDVWLVTRYDDVVRLFSDDRLSADPRVHDRYRPPVDPLGARWLSEVPFRSLMTDGQSTGRRLVSAALTPRAAARLEGCVREVVQHCAESLRGLDRIDLIGQFTVPVSIAAVGRMLGVPPKADDETHFRELAVLTTAATRPFLSAKKQQRTEQAVGEMCEYILGLVSERAAAPQADLISDLIRASEGGTLASHEEITRVISGLVSAGTGTTAMACGRALHTLLKHPDAMGELRDDRSLLPNAVEELLRYDSGHLVFPRYVVEGFTLRGRTLQRGQMVLLSILGANRDPSVFAEPDVLDLRRDARDAMSFGHGPHYCVGSNIARLELRLMIDAALDFLPEGARLLEDEMRWSAKGLMSQIKSLPVACPRATGQAGLSL